MFPDKKERYCYRSKKGAPNDASAIEACVVEAVWNTNLHFTQPRPHATAQLTF